MMIDLINRELAGLKFIYDSTIYNNTLKIEPDFSGNLDNPARIDLDFCFWDVGSLVINNKVSDLRIELIKTISDEGYCCGLFNEVYNYIRGAVFKVKLVDGENIELTTPQKCLLLALGYLVQGLEWDEMIRKDKLLASMLYTPESIEVAKSQALKFYAYYCLSVNKHAPAYNGKLATLDRIRMTREFNGAFIDEFLANTANGLRKNTNVENFVRERLIPALRKAWREQHIKKSKSDTKSTIWSKQKTTKGGFDSLKFYVSNYLDRKFK